jgi:DNA-binding MarR family transcriptional regulator
LAIGRKDREGLKLDKSVSTVFHFFNEVGIIQQLSSAMLNKRLPDGLHVSHFSVLNHLVRLGDGATPLALASAFQVSKGTMTNTLVVLSKRGLVQLEPHETDGRSKLVFLTEEGRTFQKSAIDSLAPAIAQLGEHLDFKVLEKLVPELQKIRAILDDNRDL